MGRVFTYRAKHIFSLKSLCPNTDQEINTSQPSLHGSCQGPTQGIFEPLPQSHVGPPLIEQPSHPTCLLSGVRGVFTSWAYGDELGDPAIPLSYPGFNWMPSTFQNRCPEKHLSSSPLCCWCHIRSQKSFQRWTRPYRPHKTSLQVPNTSRFSLPQP